MKKVQFGKTWRETYDGKKIVEGQEWCRKCCSVNCDYCGTGTYKKPFKRKVRYSAKKEIKNQLVNS